MRNSHTSMRTARPRHRAVLVAVLAMLFFLPPNILGQTAHATQLPDTAESHLGKGYDALKQEHYEVAAEEFFQPRSQSIRHSFCGRNFPWQSRCSSNINPPTLVTSLKRAPRGGGPPQHFVLSRQTRRRNERFRQRHQELERRNGQASISPHRVLPWIRLLQAKRSSQRREIFEGSGGTQPARLSHPVPTRVRLSQRGPRGRSQKSLTLSEGLHRQDDTEAQLRTECGEKLDKGPREEARAACRSSTMPTMQRG